MGKITIFARMGVKPENVENLKALAAEGCKGAADEPGTSTTRRRTSTDLHRLA